MTNILITGIAGFIGSNFAYYIAKTYPDYTIIGVDKLSPYSNRVNIASLEDQNRVLFYQADISDESQISKVYESHDIDYVVNFAAESHNDRAIHNPSVFVMSNVVGTQVLMDLSRKHKVTRHIHISTIEVYGEQAPGVPYFTEGSPLNAKTPYSAAKAAGDQMVRAYMFTYRDLDIALTHCANNYGPYQFPEKLIPLAVTNVLRGKKIPLYGDGQQRRDWLHVTDHCAGIDLVLHRPYQDLDEEAVHRPELLPIYDFSARQEMTNIDIIRLITDELNLAFDDSVEYVADRPNHDRRYLINPGKAEKDLGFKPSVEIDTGMRETIRWYVDHASWWKDIIDRTGNLQMDWSTFTSKTAGSKE